MSFDNYKKELDKRISRADAHTNEMRTKYWQESYDMGRGSSRPGFETWRQEMIGSHGQSTWSYERPVPYSELYPSWLLRRLYWEHTTLLLPSLTSEFLGDSIDLDYIESVLACFEELGAATIGRIIIADDRREPRLAGSSATIDTLIASNYPLDFTAYIVGGEQLMRRISLVRNWLQRASITPLEDTFMAVEELPKPTFSQIGTRKISSPDLRDATINLDRFFTDIKEVNTSTLDFIAEKVGFWPPVPDNRGGLLYPNWHVSYAPAKLNAIADSLRDFLKATMKQEFILAVSQRLGYPKNRIDNTGGIQYDQAKGEAKKALGEYRNSRKDKGGKKG